MMDINIVPEDVVISGIGGYFPKAKNIEEFKKVVYENVSLLEAKWPEGEKNCCNLIGSIDSDHFDNSYFGIHRQQCLYMDPMHRVALERTFEALVDAGVNPHEIKGKRIGVFMGSTIGENDNLFMESVVSGFGVTGHSRAMMPNRISYWLNLKGPSVAYDCNWVSGTEVLRLAFLAIKTGQCDSVIVGTTNVSTHSEFQWLYTDMGLASLDGSTRAFDASATGYARSEGVVVLYVQRASDARRHYASIVHIATRFDGNREGDLLTVDSENMVEFLEEFYEKSPVKPEQVEYVETYGCAVKNIDKSELDALEKVYCKNRKSPLMIGSVKTITGHSEATASLFSIVQAIIAMEKGIIPATLQFQTPNPDIQALNNGNMEVVTQNRQWSAEYAAVNSIGIDSYYSHVLLKSNPKKKVPIEVNIPTLLVASTRTEDGITTILENLKNKPQDPEFYKLVQDVFSRPIQGHLHRGYVLFGEEGPKHEISYVQGNKRPIWFVYAGMGSQWCGMVSDFMKIDVFAKSIMKCHEILAPKGVDLLNIITTSDKTIFDNILHCFVGIAAIQIALTDVLKAVGIEPDAIIGHSVGELGCAYADGCMTAEQMILSSYSRGRASLEATLVPGMMAAIGLGYNQIKNRLPPTIEVACHNGPESCTISGPTEDMEVFVKELQEQGVFARLVNVANIAYHSRYIKPAAPFLLKYLKEVLPQPVPRSSKWISTSNQESDWDTDLAKHSSAEYHTNNLLSSVLFEEGCKHIPSDAILIEIAPHGLLQAILKRSVKEATNVPLTQRGIKSGVEFLLQSFGKLYCAGMDMKISNIYPKIEYPVSRNTPALGDLVQWNHTDIWKKGEDTTKSGYGISDVLISLHKEEFRELVGHNLNDNVVLPISYYLENLFQSTDRMTERNEVIFENLHFRKSVVVPRTGFVSLNSMVQSGSGEFEIYSNDDLVLTGKIIFPLSGDEFVLEKAEVQSNNENVLLTRSDVYNELQHRGHTYAGSYKSLKSLILSEEGSIGTSEWKEKWTYLVDAMIQQHIFQAGEKCQEVHVPRHIQRIAISFPQLPTEKKDIEVAYEYATNIISTDGIQISGTITVPLEAEDNVHLEAIECVSLTTQFSRIESGIEFAVQLAAANNNEQDIKTAFLTEIESAKSLGENIKNVINDSKQLNINFSTVAHTQQIAIHQSQAQVFVYNDTVNENILKLLSYTNILILTKPDKSIISDQQVIQVAEFTVGTDNYVILRKSNPAKVQTINIRGDTLSVKDLKRNSVAWVSELYAAAEEAMQKPKLVFLITSLVPAEGFLNFVQELKSLPNMKCLRIIFNFDKKTVDYTQIIQRNLVISILKSGTWYTYLPLSCAFKDDTENVNSAVSGIVENNTITYISVNLRDETLNPARPKRNEVGNIDYAGTNKNGEEIMGLAYLDKDTTKLVPDQTFTWTLPDSWTLEDAVTVPHAYVCAYYMLFTKAVLKHGDTVLIHAGCSPIGLAASSIAHTHGCNVFVSVATNAQKAFLRKYYPYLRDYNILDSESSSFSSELMMATGGKGAEVILNCVSGSLLQNSLSCIADYGRFIQYGKYDTEEGTSIGMYCFLRNASFYVVNLENVFMQPKDVKEEIKSIMVKGIEDYIVRPLPREIVKNYSVDDILSKIKSSSNIGKVAIAVNNNFSVNKLNVNRPNKFICSSKLSYFIYGGSSENWTDLAEWLVRRGARRIVVASDSKPQQAHVNRRLSLLQSTYGASIVTAQNKAHTREGAVELISEVYTLGPVHAVFTLPAKATANSRCSDAKPVQYLDQALRTVAPKAVLVNFVRSAAGVCYNRAEAGFGTHNVQWQKVSDIADGVSALDSVLRLRVSNVFVNKSRDGEQKAEGSQGGIKDMSKVIPTIEHIIREQKIAPAEPELVQVITEGPLEMRELAPLFIVPGIMGQAELEKMFDHLLYPTFVTTLPAAPLPIDRLAEVFAQKMQDLYPKGVFNIVSVSSGGPLAIAIARILHSQNASLHIFFVDSAPNKIQQALKALGETANDQSLNLLRRVFDFDDMEIVKKLEATNDWESKIQIAIGSFEGSDRNRKLLTDGVIRIKHQIDSIMTFQPNDVLVSGKIHLISTDDSSPYDSYGLSSYCQQAPKIQLAPGNHLSIISEEVAYEYINKNHYLI